MLNPRPLNKPATRDRTPNSFSTRTEIVCRMSAVAAQNLHDAVLAGELDLLNALSLQIFFRSEVPLVLKALELPLQLEMLLVVAAQFLVAVDEGENLLFFVLFHGGTPRE